jgi:hypothetical protein
VGDELVTGATQLVGVTIAGEVEGARHRGPVDVDRVELLDDREEIGEKLSLL